MTVNTGRDALVIANKRQGGFGRLPSKQTNKQESNMAKTKTGHGQSGRGKCSCCLSPRRAEIELALCASVPLNSVAARYDISPDSLSRHWRNHVPASIRAAIATQLKPEAIDLEQLQRSESESLLQHLVVQRARLATLAQLAVESGSPAAAIRAEVAVTHNLELVSRLLGQLVSRSEITTKSFLVTTDYIRLRSAIVQALKPYPQAAVAVAAAVAAIEADVAADVTARASKPKLIEHVPIAAQAVEASP
jgi:hypothetical protein